MWWLTRLVVVCCCTLHLDISEESATTVFFLDFSGEILQTSCKSNSSEMANVPRPPATLTDSCAANAALKGCRFSRFPADFALFLCLFDLFGTAHVPCSSCDTFSSHKLQAPWRSPHRGIYLIRGMSTGRSSQFCLGLTVQKTLPTWLD